MYSSVHATQTRCCADSDLGDDWVDVDDRPHCPADVWGRTPQGPCPSSMPFDESKSLCESIGGRLCTLEEVNAQCVAYTGCTNDDRLIWTSTTGPRGGFERVDIGTWADVDVAMGLAVADYDNDGDLDIYIPQHTNNLLLRNNGDGSFTDVALSLGVQLTTEDDHYPTAALFCDFNQDGMLDLFVTHRYSANALLMQRTIVDANGELGTTFEDVAVVAGVDDPDEAVRPHGAACFDFDNDGLLDIYVVIFEGGANRLYHQLTPVDNNPRFEEVAIEAHVADDAPGRGVAVADWNRDGYLDIAVATDNQYSGGSHNKFFQNTGQGGFEHLSPHSTWPSPSLSSRGLAFGDFNNDMWPVRLCPTNPLPFLATILLI